VFEKQAILTEENENAFLQKNPNYPMWLRFMLCDCKIMQQEDSWREHHRF
jgi:hypothetical protein